jgi:hypothetical protein
MIFKATRELQFLEALLEKRKKVLQKRKQLKNPTFFPPKSKSGQDESKAGKAPGGNQDEELTDLLLNDEFAPEVFSDSEYSDEEGEDVEPEFYPLKVGL